MRIIYLCFFLPLFVLSQKSINYLDNIDSLRIKHHVSVLANDSLEGRNTGDLGQKKAAKYLQEEFRKIGLDSLSEGYFQKFYLLEKNKNGNVKIGKKKLIFSKDFGFLSYFLEYNTTFKVDKILDLAELKNNNYDGIENLVIYANEFTDINLDEINKLSSKNILFVCKTYNSQYFTKYNENSLSLPDKKNQKVYLFLNESSLKGKIKKGDEITISINKGNKELKQTENVIGFLPGSDSLLKNEFIVISAHYDHLGIIKNQVYNGADDNASGTAALLELARVFKELSISNLQAKRSILFICFTGEEHGLLGSEFYSKNPLIPLKETVADFNIDMIGRKNELLEKDKFSVYAIGSDKISLDFHKIHESCVKQHGKLNIDYKYNDPKDKERLYYRSDHYNFAKNGIPSIFYFGGFHADYHQPTDDIEKLNFTKIKLITELVFLTVFEVGNL